jgi:hypothetical protein
MRRLACDAVQIVCYTKESVSAVVGGEVRFLSELQSAAIEAAS